MPFNRENVEKFFREPRYRESSFKWAVRTILNRKTVDRNAIKWAFCTLLDREPESDAVYEAHARAASLTDLVEMIAKSVEFRLRYINRDSIKLVDQKFSEQTTVGRDSVVWAYRTLLDREPDSEAAIQTLSQAPTITALVENILHSHEFRLRYINRDSIRLVDRMLVDNEPAPASEVVDDLQVILLQTCDPHRYFPLLSCGRKANEHYAIKNGFGYSAFVGLKRGYFPWQTTFNRIPMLKELSAGGYRGWAFYIDADAYVRDQSFDLRAYLTRHKDKSFIGSTGGVTGERWEINAGVFLINLGHPHGRRLIDLWHWHFMATQDEALRLAAEWDDVLNDQTRLYEILQANPYLLEHVHVENHTFQDTGEGGFVRQVMRCLDMSLEGRLKEMRAGIDALEIPDTN
jgi:hypothetical protein